MPTFEHGDTSLYYEEYGAGFPLLLFAPGGMHSAIDFWHRSPFDPTVEFAANFRVIAMDQRNAGRSRAPLGTDGWATYTSDQLALLDHLRIDRCHVMGGCIGSSYCLGIVEAVPERIASAVLQNPIGLSEENRPAFIDMFDDWAKELQQSRPDFTPALIDHFRERMFGGEFVFNVTREFVRRCPTPMLVLAGNDNFHPAAIAREIAGLAPHAELVGQWSTGADVAAAVERTGTFLRLHTP